jgi:hypothetical protein
VISRSNKLDLYLAPTTKADVDAALLTVNPGWSPGSAFSKDQAAHAVGILLSGKISQAAADEASDDQLAAEAHAFIDNAYVAPASAVPFCDLAELTNWRQKALQLHATALASDDRKNKAAIKAIVGVVSAAAVAYATGNPLAAIAAVEPLIAAFQAYSGSGDVAEFDSLTPAA